MYNPWPRAIDFKRIFHSLQFNFIENFMLWFQRSNLWLLTMGSQREAKAKPNVTQKNSMEAKKPKVYGCYLIFVPKRENLT